MRLIEILILVFVASVASAGIINSFRLTAGGGIGFDKTGLELWMDLDGDINDDSGNHTPVLKNSPNYVTGPFSDSNGAIECTNTGDHHFYVPDAAGLSPSGDMSIVMWIRTRAEASYYLWGKYDVVGQRSFYARATWSTTYFYKMYLARTDDGSTMESEQPLYPNPGIWEDLEWKHVAIVYTHSNNEVQYYYNATTPTAAVDFDTETGNLYDGTSDLWPGGLTETLVSEVDLARISLWSRALSASEISDLYNGGSDIKYSDL